MVSSPLLPKNGRAYVSAVILAGFVAIAWSIYELDRHPIGFQWFMLAALTLVSGSATVKLPSVPASISISETFVFAAVLLYGPAAGTLIVTLDGYGSGLAGSVSHGQHGSITRVHDIEYPHSLGTYYESVTSALGLKPSRHEGKVVGLAAYGDPEILKDVLLARFEQRDGDFKILESNNLFFARMLASQFPKIDVAAAYQRVLEIVATNYVAYYVRQTGLRNLVLSGGVVANVKLNQRLKEIPGVDKIFIHPNMGDGGCGTGAALLKFSGTADLSKPLSDDISISRLSKGASNPAAAARWSFCALADGKECRCCLIH